MILDETYKRYNKEKDVSTVLVTYKAYLILIERNPYMGYLSGYIGVNSRSFLYGKHYDDIMRTVLRDYGIKLEYSGPKYVKNIIRIDKNDEHWWLGFHEDQPHNFVPGAYPEQKLWGDVYADIPTVMHKCINLIEYIILFGHPKKQPNSTKCDGECPLYGYPQDICTNCLVKYLIHG